MEETTMRKAKGKKVFKTHMVEINTVNPENKSFRAWLLGKGIVARKNGKGINGFPNVRYCGSKEALVALCEEHFAGDMIRKIRLDIQAF